jgi:hypothetical protein
VAEDHRDLKESVAIPESQERRVLMGHPDLLDHLDHQVKEESVVRADQ